MIATVLAMVMFVLATFSAANDSNYQLCFAGNYCGPLSGLVAQPGPYTNAQACANKCSSTTTNKFFSYVPTSQQCLCATICNDQIANPNVDSYCLNAPLYTQCWSGKYCGPNSAIHTQPGLYNTPGDCANQCFGDHAGYNFFNYVPSTKQCQCTATCATLVTNPNVFGYALNSQTCTSGSP